jgi:4-amino-4-deoxy-L-arabinose transferase-like glycosyltransferase
MHNYQQSSPEASMTSTPAMAPEPQPGISLRQPVAATAEPSRSADRVPALAWLIAAAFVAIELAISGRYGFMQDELYFIVASHHLAFSYVDQPPLAVLLTRITDVLGVNPTAIRIAPALMGGAVVVLTARQAALFGAGRSGRVLAALAMACAPVLLGADHSANTTPPDLLAWTVVVVCVSTALLRDRPRWWLGAGVAAGLGLESDNIVFLLLVVLAVGIFFSVQRPVLGTWWPWLGSAVALVIWLPDLIWQATHSWTELAMSAALHRENDSAGAIVGGIPSQLIDAGILVSPLIVAGFVRLWRTAELRFLAIAATLVVAYVAAWVPGKAYYVGGVIPVVLAAGAAAAESWAKRGRRPALRRGLLIAAPIVGFAAIVSFMLPILPVSDVHKLPATSQTNSQVGDTVGWPQLTAAVAAQDAALSRSGQRPTSIFTGYYPEAATLQVFGGHDHLPPVLSGHNAYWTWGPGTASDRTVLAVDALGQLKPYFASCRLLTTYYAPYHVQNNWTDIQIGVCTGPVAGWNTIWPHLKRYQ